jgi:hypothetical protein
MNRLEPLTLYFELPDVPAPFNYPAPDEPLEPLTPVFPELPDVPAPFNPFAPDEPLEPLTPVFPELPDTCTI